MSLSENLPTLIHVAVRELTYYSTCRFQRIPLRVRLALYSRSISQCVPRITAERSLIGIHGAPSIGSASVCEGRGSSTVF